MINITFRRVIESPWTELEPVRLGRVPPGLGTPGAYVTVLIDERPLLRVDLYSDPGEDVYEFEEAIAWKQFLVIGSGQKVYLVSMENKQSTTIDLGGHYFGQLYPQSDVLLIASSKRLFCIDSQVEIRWSTEPLGIDGVVVDNVDEGIIYGKGELDPPGGWRSFKVNLSSGKLV